MAASLPPCGADARLLPRPELKLHRALILRAALLALLPSLASAGLCDLDVQPAATLLIPYFAVDLADPAGTTTLFSVNNAFPEPALAHVTLWTDFALPTLTFDIYLTGFDVQTINLRDVFVSGRLPATGSGVSNAGDFSRPGDFPGCNPGSEPGAPPVYPDPALDAAALAHLRSRHTGHPSPLDGRCGGAAYGDAIARGFLTIDAANRCSDLNPKEQGYFLAGGTGVASNENVLWGDYFYVHPARDFAQSEMAVHIEADAAAFGDGDHTFYARAVGFSGADAREPLGFTYAVRFLNGGPFAGGTALVVWRDAMDRSFSSVECEINALFCTGAIEVHFDEEENAVEALNTCLFSLGPFRDTFKYATQAFRYGAEIREVPWEFGVTQLFLGGTVEGQPPRQAWVSAVLSAEGRYSVGHRALRLDSACDGQAILPPWDQ